MRRMLVAAAPARRREAVRNLRALAAGFGKPDRDRLLAARHLLLAATAPERALLAASHRAFHGALSGRSVSSRHDLSGFASVARRRPRRGEAFPPRAPEDPGRM